MRHEQTLEGDRTTDIRTVPQAVISRSSVTQAPGGSRLRQSHGATANTPSPNAVRPINTPLKPNSNVGKQTQLTPRLTAIVATASTSPVRGRVSNSRQTRTSTAHSPYQNQTAQAGAGP